jgi:hypothetical protein
VDDERKGCARRAQRTAFMTSARHWDGIERRKARPSKDSIIDLLNGYGTDFPEPEKNAVDFRKMYYDLLARPWERRGMGLPYGRMLTLAILAAVFSILIGAALAFSLLPGAADIASGTVLLAALAVVVWGTAITGVLLLILSRLSINRRTIAHAPGKYPLVRRAACRLADSSKDEVVRDYLPVLHIDGKPFFQIVYIKKGDASKTPTGVLILDDQGRAILQYGILEKVKRTASFGILCGHILQQRAEHIRRSMKHVIDIQLPDAVKVLSKQERQFADHGLASRWTALLDDVASLPQALRESITILEAEEDFRNAMGYGFALEFRYEDAQKLRDLYLAYVKFLNAAYRRKIISLTTEAAMLIQILETKTDWREKDSALAALSTLAVAGTNSFLARICQKEYEGMVNDGDRKAYQEKTLYAKNIGWQVITD